MFIAETCARLGKSGLNRAAVLVGWGSVAQAEAEKDCSEDYESNSRLKLCWWEILFHVCK